MVQDLKELFDQQQTRRSQNDKELFEQTIQNAVKTGYEKADEDLRQRVDGMQGRIDSMNLNTVQAERQASADHALLEQLFQSHKEMLKAVTQNTVEMQRLTHQLQLPINVSGKDVLRALKDETQTSVHRHISEQVAKLINEATTKVKAYQESVESDQKLVLQSERRLANYLDDFRGFLFFAFSGVILAMLTPWWPLKLALGLGGILGGYLHGKSKSDVD